jgi:CBS domain containing-hemolysin-like protein
MQAISDKLFMGSIILLMVSAVFSGIGFQFASWRTQVHEDIEQAESGNASRKKIVIDKQDKSLSRFFRSILMWISIAGIVTSIVLSYLAR